MDILKMVFPFSFKATDNQSFITLLVLFVIGEVICCVLGWLLGQIPILGIITNIIFWLAGIYLLASLVIGILVFLGILKSE
ncbi:MAG: hypothetical protein ACI39R_06465 [Lachnospiraceae bacterium]